MTRLETLLRKVRIRLHDLDKNRWSDEDLLSVLQDALNDIAVHTRIFKTSYVIDLFYGQYLYTMPDEYFELQRAIYAGKPLPVISQEEAVHMFGHDWRSHSTTSELSHLIKTDIQQDAIQVYPRPYIKELDLAEFEPDVFGFEEGIATYTTVGEYGIAGTLADAAYLDATDEYGVISEMKSKQTIILQYTKRPQGPISLEGTIPLPNIFDNALKSYIIAHSLLNDLDSENRQAGASELSLYSRELERMQESSANHYSPDNSFSTTYQGIG